VLLLASDRALLEKLARGRIVDADAPDWVGRLWRALRSHARVAIEVPKDSSLSAACRRVALRLGLAKVIWVDPDGPLVDADGERISLVDGAGIESLLRGRTPGNESRRELLREVRTMVAGGVPAVNLCDAAGLEADLFTFEGSGTFFARERYLDVRRLALDDFDAAERLIERGVEEGYLAPRGPEQLEIVLTNAFGVFVEGRYLAGVGALLPHAPGDGRECGEISSLYTLTRFLGEGIGGHLVRFAVGRAAEMGFGYVFACTTSERVQSFFERQGFRAVGRDAVPEGKWAGYPEERLARVRCLRRDLDT
jgi:N-acetylglutamate synthase-like GNAT family acetyltransferase